jgi:hypothetical protein
MKGQLAVRRRRAGQMTSQRHGPSLISYLLVAVAIAAPVS